MLCVLELIVSFRISISLISVNILAYPSLTSFTVLDANVKDEVVYEIGILFYRVVLMILIKSMATFFDYM